MITLITGAPGAGKTALMVELLRTIYKDRPVYACNVEGLTLPHFQLDDLSKWPEVVPDGSLVVCDEVQRFWRPRGPGQKVPADVSALETHRHRGLDFIVLTQGPNLLDRNVRALTGRHVHLRDTGLLGRWWYEWPECSEGLAWKSAPLKKRYKLPRKAFDSYKSASMHVKPVRSFPMMAAVAAVALVGFGFFAWKSYGVVHDGMTGKGAAQATAATRPDGAASGAAVQGERRYGSQPRTAAQYDRALRPVVPYWPETAAVYDEVRTVQRVERVIGGYCRGTECRCFNQDGLRPRIDARSCEGFVKDPAFNPWWAPQVVHERGSREGARSESVDRQRDSL